MCASTGKFNLERLNEKDEEEENNHKLSGLKISEHKNHTAKKPLARRQTDSQIGSKTTTPRGGSLMKTGSKSSLNGVHAGSPHVQKKQITRSISHNK